MRPGRFQFGLAAALLAGIVCLPAYAQRTYERGDGESRPVFREIAQKNAQQKMNQRAQVRAQMRANAQNRENAVPKGQANLRTMAALPPKWVEQLRDMSPEEQERFMQNNQLFQSLPAQRQQQIHQNLQKWNNLSPTERNAIREREHVFESFSPEQRQHLQGEILPKWQQMTPDRRQVIIGRLHTLHSMPPEDREAALNNPRFMQGLSPDEQSVLRDLSSLRNPTD